MYKNSWLEKQAEIKKEPPRASEIVPIFGVTPAKNPHPIVPSNDAEPNRKQRRSWRAPVAAAPARKFRSRKS